jgi:hypothetical protein
MEVGGGRSGRLDEPQLREWREALEAWLNQAVKRCATAAPLLGFLDPGPEHAYEHFL